jgi:ATP-binding cassette subfamily B protein
MLKIFVQTFVRLLGDGLSALRRYLWLAVAYGLLCGLTMAALVPLCRLLLAGEPQQAWPWLAALLAGVWVCWVWRSQVEQAGVRVGVAVLRNGRHCVGTHVARLPVGWFTPQNTARMGHVVTQGMMAVAQLPAHVFTPVISGVVTPLVLALVLLALQPRVGLLALLALPLLGGVLWCTARLAAYADRVFQQHFAQTSQRMVEFAQAQSVLRAFQGEGGGTRFLEQAVARQHQSALRLMLLSALSVVLNTWAVQAVFVALLAASLWGLAGSGTASDAVALTVVLLLVVRFIDPLLEVASYSEVLRSAGGQLEAVREILDAQPLPQTATPQAPQNAAITLRDVHVRYAPQAPDVLRGVNLHLAPGSMTALIGASGSGKSTLARLVARFFDVSQGQICIGGVDLRQMSEAQLAGQISQIFQDSYLFAGSIADNIRMGKPAASAQELLQAAELAGVSEMLERLPQGLDTPVGEGGAQLSGGERQRIAIARALIKDTPILLVDEATAALDAGNQAVIAQTLARLRGQRTMLVIAHQLSTVAMADQIVVLEAGQVVEQGTPADLLASAGRYAHFLAQRQMAKGWRMTPVASEASH